MSATRFITRLVLPPIPFVDSSPKSVVDLVHALELFPLILGAIAAGFGVVGSVIFLAESVYGSDATGGIALPVVAAAGYALFALGRWMRRALPAKNPKAWYVHAILGWPVLALWELVPISMLWADWHGRHRLIGVATFVIWNWLITLPGARLQRRWMSPEMKLWFGISPHPSQTPCVPEE